MEMSDCPTCENPSTLADLIDKYTHMLEGFVAAFDAIQASGIDAVRGLLNVESDLDEDNALIILTAYQTALVNVLNDLESVEKQMRVGSEN